MRVIGKLKDGTGFTHNDIMRIDDHEGIIIVHRKDGTPRSMKREDIEHMRVDFLLPKSEIPTSRPGRLIELD